MIHGLPVKSSKSDWLTMRNEYSAHAQEIGSGQSSRSQPQARRIVGSGDENGALGATISGMRHRCRLCSETGWADSVITLVISKWLLPELSFSDCWSWGTNTLGTRLVLTTMWCHLWSITEQMHGNMESICLNLYMTKYKNKSSGLLCLLCPLLY